MQKSVDDLLSTADIPKVAVLFQKRVYASTSCVFVGSFFETSDLICLNGLLNPLKIYA